MNKANKILSNTWIDYRLQSYPSSNREAMSRSGGIAEVILHHCRNVSSETVTEAKVKRIGDNKYLQLYFTLCLFSYHFHHQFCSRLVVGSHEAPNGYTKTNLMKSAT